MISIQDNNRIPQIISDLKKLQKAEIEVARNSRRGYGKKYRVVQ
ncbi:hypothetical protein [Halobacillus yeomjeoni]|nr:hypothetical protein [Halobacillus yeomjeoni]